MPRKDFTMIRYIVPFYYTCHSRSKGIHFLSYLVMVVFPQFLLCCFYGAEKNLIKLILEFLVAFCGMLSIYESGYIVNDSICIKKDPKPSERIQKDEEEFLAKNIFSIVILKISLSLICAIFFVLSKGFQLSVLYILSLCILIGMYAIHNAFRSFVNFFTVFILTTFNYFSTATVFVEQKGSLIFCLLIIVLSFSVPKTFFYIQRKCFDKKDKFGFSIFYLVESVAFILISFFSDFDFRVSLIPVSQFVWRFCTSVLKYRKGRSN